MSDVTLLRKLTLKSTLKFGKFSEVPIGNLIDINETTYLRWVYFNFSKITFIDEILDSIKIPENYRIEKPGKNEQFHTELTEFLLSKMSFNTKNHVEKRKKQKFKNKKRQLKNEDRINYSKSSLARKNQGH